MFGITNSSNAPSVVLRGKIVSSWSELPSSGTDSDMKTAGYTYYASISEAGTMENSIAEVTFSDTDAKSGNYAPICRTYAGEIRVYSKVNTTITIPSIVIHSTVETYNYTLDSGPVEGSTKAVMSGGVFTALTGKQDNITVQSTWLTNNSGVSSGGCVVYKYGKVCWASIDIVPTGSGATVSFGFPTGYKPARTFYVMIGNYVSSGYTLAYYNGTSLSFVTPNGNGQCCVFIYMTNE